MNPNEIYLIKDYLRVNGFGGFVEPIPEPEAHRYPSELHLSAGRNQYVSFQIVLEPESGSLDSIDVRFSALSTPQGQLLPPENATLYTEWFHRVGEKLVPDLLIPWEAGCFRVPLDAAYLPDQRAGAVWVDLWIPPEQPAGSYQGTLSVQAGRSTHTFRLVCQVGAFAVPSTGRLTADLNNYADAISPAFASLRDAPNRYRDGSYLAVEREFYRMAREHRCLFHNLPYRHSGDMPEGFCPELEGEGKFLRVKSWELFDRHFGPYLDGSAFAGCRMGEQPLEFMYLPFHLGWPANYEKWGHKGYRTEYRRILQEFVRHFEEKGWISTYLEILLNHKKDYRFFPYTVDEIWYEHDQAIVDAYYEIIQGIYETSPAKFLFRMDSSNYFGEHFNHRFSDYCKMWVAGAGMFSWFPESVEVMREKGNLLWIYGSVLQELDESLLTLYTWPVQCVMTGVTGFTVWNTTGFGGDPLRCPAALGGEALFYPGSYFGLEAPLPSIRLKALRNAMQLAELALSLRGTPLEREMEACLCGPFGMAGRGDWFREKPAFLNTPPRYWDFDKAVPEACLPPLHIGRSPALSDQLTARLHALLNRGEEKREGVQFQFQ